MAEPLTEASFPTYYRFRDAVGGPPKAIELHISADTAFPRLFGADVKASGGQYNHARGHAYDRIVTVGSAGGFARMLELCDDILNRIGPGAGGRGRHYTVIVHGTGNAGNANANLTVDYLKRGESIESIETSLRRYIAKLDELACAYDWKRVPAPETDYERERRLADELAAGLVSSLRDLGLRSAVRQGALITIAADDAAAIVRRLQRAPTNAD